ncbi:SpaA isopeptide-forming pilin-related protein [Leucobacter sp. wl10]|uniref:SpaA isopeptide-forming pilin-related protein n=1 Tax=Leucobacter sp. wl10 TaxID=2304677 RepID=UPI000E5AACD8|nr:SpaA isopeptide-forming pilin-related protein [Leucobacter sp. wl10]RGE16749.1 hypothetical protein D1J51_16625 [Leucobacter sp. wl10]
MELHGHRQRGRHRGDGAAPRRARARRRSRSTELIAVVAACAIALLGAAPAFAQEDATAAERVQTSPSAEAPPAESGEAADPAPAPESPTGESPSTPAPEQPAADPAPEQPSATAAQDPATELPPRMRAPEAKALEIPQTASAAAAPNGASAPYAYWNVVDTDGNAVPGATFSLERRSGHGWTGTRNVSDCTAGTCAAVDRDGDAGDYLAKWIGSDTPGANPSGTGASNVIQADSQYRIRPGEPPAGYVWSSSTAWVDSNAVGWSGASGNRTLSFGTFVLKKLKTQPTCEAGYVYAISTTGQMQEVAPDGSVSDIGRRAPDVSVFNGLGIGAGGQPVYGLLRSSGSGTSQNGTVYSYDVATGEWASTGASTSALGGNTGTNLIGGAVDLSNGLYYFGGFTSDGDFKLYEYDPSATPRIKLKGTIDIAADSSANGDLAFDAVGNLFVVHGEGTTTTVYSVTAANVAAANGGTIPSSISRSVTTMSNVNGVSFDAGGKAYLGSEGQIRSFNMPGWGGSSTVVSSGITSTDLATCSSPPTITVEKYIDGQRVNAGDQFKLTLKQGGQTIGEATTEGTSPGLQDKRIGPLPTVRGVELAFSETASGSTDLNQYVSSYRCLVDGVQTSQAENTTTGRITIPEGGQTVECRFFNAPLVAQVSINKKVTDAQGANPVPRQGWTVGAKAVSAPGSSVTSAPGTATQTTNAAGNAAWAFTFGAKDQTATVSVEEAVDDGFVFQSGQCTVTSLDGTTSSTALTGPSSTQLPGIVPGDRVDCSYVNRVNAASLTLVKRVENRYGGTGGIADWTLTAAGPTQGVAGRTGEPAVTGRTVAPGEYTLSESSGPGGYEASGWECVNTGAGGAPAVNGDRVAVPLGGAVTCTVTNSDSPGAIAWSKVAKGTSDTLRGSQWRIDGPGFTPANREISDCVEASATSCEGLDRDPSAGRFKLEQLRWGDYTVTETVAPPGYVGGASFTFAVNAGTAGTTIDQGPIENAQQAGLAIPFTGGIASDLFTLGGLGLGTLAALAAGLLAYRQRVRRQVATM